MSDDNTDDRFVGVDQDMAIEHDAPDDKKASGDDSK